MPSCSLPSTKILSILQNSVPIASLPSLNKNPPLFHYSILLVCFLQHLVVLLGITVVLGVCVPTPKKRLLRNNNFVSLIPQKLSGPGSLPCAEQVKEYFRRTDGSGRNPFRRVLTPHKMHYRALSESPCYISQSNYKKEGLRIHSDRENILQITPTLGGGGKQKYWSGT